MPVAPACTLKGEIKIALHGQQVLVNGTQIEELSEGPWRRTALTKLLGPCSGSDNASFDGHLSLELDAEGSAESTRRLLNEIPDLHQQNNSLRIGNSPGIPVKLSQVAATAPTHWVRLVVQPAHIRALELARDASSGAATTRVLRDLQPKKLAEALSFLRTTCAAEPCQGVIVSLGEANNSLPEVVLEAIHSSAAPAPILALRQVDDTDHSSENELRFGSIAPEVIQGLVRKQYGLFRKCYEQGLARNPNLEGRVAVRFVIELDGSVRHAELDESTLPDAEVARCVVEQFSTLKFPKPDGGIVTVVYPIMLSPG